MHEIGMTRRRALSTFTAVRGTCRVFNVCADGEAWRGGRSDIASFPARRLASHSAWCIPHSTRTCCGFRDPARPPSWMCTCRRIGLALSCTASSICVRKTCVARLRSNNLSRLRQHVHQTANNRSSALAIAGMMLLLGVCAGTSADRGSRRAVTGGEPQPTAADLARGDVSVVRRRLLRPRRLPGLSTFLGMLARRAGLCRLPDLYCLAAPNDMNAYAWWPAPRRPSCDRGCYADDARRDRWHLPMRSPHPQQDAWAMSLGGNTASRDRVDS